MEDSIPLKRCTKCKQDKPATLEHFSANKTRPDGLQHRCKQCVKEAWALTHPKKPKTPKVSDVPSGYKRCVACKQVKPANTEYFHVAVRQTDGLDYYCKTCKSQKQKARYVHKRPDYTVQPGYKRCHKCLQVKPAALEYFHRDESKRDRLTTSCKECKISYVKSYAVKNAEQIRERQKRRRITKREYYTTYLRRYYQNNRESLLAQNKLYYQAHREIVIRRQKQYYINNHDRERESRRRYHATHREQQRVRNRRRRARMRNVPGTHTAQDVRNQFARQHGRCYYCHKKLGSKYHVDHVIPITRDGSSNNPWNLVIACQSCNCSKRNRLLHEWPEGGRLL